MLKLAVLAVVLVAVQAAPRPEEEKYKSRLDNINVDEVIKNSRLVENYVKCALDKGKCTPEGRDIKMQILDLLPEILETNCAKCTEDQRAKVIKVIRHLANHSDKKIRDYLPEILDKYDPKKELRTKYKEKYSDLAKDEGLADLLESI